MAEHFKIYVGGMKMQKPKVTQEQAEIIKNIENPDYVIDIHAFKKRPDIAIADMKVSDLAKAFYVGYEVIREYKKEDWLVDESGNVVKVTELDKKGILTDGGNPSLWFGKRSDGYSKLRYATPMEISEEKERRWWKRHGRKPWELKEGDLLMSLDDVHEVENPTSYGVWFKGFTSGLAYRVIKENYKVVCFKEDRKDA